MYHIFTLKVSLQIKEYITSYNAWVDCQYAGFAYVYSKRKSFFVPQVDWVRIIFYCYYNYYKFVNYEPFVKHKENNNKNAKITLAFLMAVAMLTRP